MSPNAIRSVIGAYPAEDSTRQLIEFFEEYKNDHNYNVEKYADTVCIEFNPQKKIAGGPMVYILDRGDLDWKVIEIDFGKWECPLFFVVFIKNKNLFIVGLSL